jgi:ribosomal protein S12 methylthiotransferase
LQHISDRILFSMKRGIDTKQTYRIVDKLRTRIPGIALRTSLITGYPGETSQEYGEMKKFIKDIRFERLGIFKYSHEEDTAAFKLADDVSKRTKESRYRALMETQQEISYKNNMSYIGKKMNVLVDDYKNNTILARTESDSPEIDNLVIIKNQVKKIPPGLFINVRITGADMYDLFAEMES